MNSLKYLAVITFCSAASAAMARTSAPSGPDSELSFSPGWQLS